MRALCLQCFQQLQMRPSFPQGALVMYHIICAMGAFEKAGGQHPLEAVLGVLRGSGGGPGGDISQYRIIEKVAYITRILQITIGKAFEHAHGKAI